MDVVAPSHTVWATRALAKAQRALDQHYDELGRGARYGKDWVARLHVLSREVERLQAGDLADRGTRRMPPVRRIAEHWGRAPDVCFRCGMGTPHPDRAHLIDRCVGGLDDVQNVALLCSLCHRMMPPFEPGEEQAARAYAFGLTPVAIVI